MLTPSSNLFRTNILVVEEYDPIRNGTSASPRMAAKAPPAVFTRPVFDGFIFILAESISPFVMKLPVAPVSTHATRRLLPMVTAKIISVLRAVEATRQVGSGGSCTIARVSIGGGGG